MALSKLLNCVCNYVDYFNTTSLTPVSFVIILNCYRERYW